jgi:hypothetical protein
VVFKREEQEKRGGSGCLFQKHKGETMALIRCHECVKKISTNAMQCPHCGTTVIKENSYHFKSEFSKKFLKFTIYFVFPILLIFLMWGGAEIFSILGILLLLTFFVIVALSSFELIARAGYYLFKGKELFPDEKKADD